MKTNYDIKLGVSLYSYQDNYYFHRLDLDGCLAAAAGAGAEGIEVFSEMMIPEWPYVSDAWIDSWNAKMDRYGLNPVCMDHFADRQMWHDRVLTDDELFERSTWFIKLAHRLGCTHIRLMHAAIMGEDCQTGWGLGYKLTTLPIVERLLPVAAENNIIMAMECHSPTSIDSPDQVPYLEAAERLGFSDYLGLQTDFGCYEYCLSTADLGQAVRMSGATEEILTALREAQRKAYFSGEALDKEGVRAKLAEMGANPADLRIIDRQLASTKPDSYQTLQEYASRLVYAHGKFYDIDESGQVDNMDYPKILGAMQAGGYKGYINSEFEGNRRMNDGGWCDEIELVRKQHVLMRSCLGRE
ncbi:MAG: TIM barrel protein [Oscillospiraceae bacterium]|nr:TIM barrel protein [Oscillospiraceae bacterium]